MHFLISLRVKTEQNDLARTGSYGDAQCGQGVVANLKRTDALVERPGVHGVIVTFDTADADAFEAKFVGLFPKRVMRIERHEHISPRRGSHGAVHGDSFVTLGCQRQFFGHVWACAENGDCLALPDSIGVPFCSHLRTSTSHLQPITPAAKRMSNAPSQRRARHVFTPDSTTLTVRLRAT